MNGYVHIYTGDGKGKTTAALGLIMRASGAGLRVYLGQFIKGGDYSEITALRGKFPDVTVEQYGISGFIKGNPSEQDIQAAGQGLNKLRQAMLGGKYDIVIADEANCAVTAGLFPVDRLLALITEKPPAIELIFTGRKADPRLIEMADLVTEMKAVKHYFKQGVAGRRGIES